MHSALSCLAVYIVLFTYTAQTLPCLLLHCKTGCCRFCNTSRHPTSLSHITFTHDYKYTISDVVLYPQITRFQEEYGISVSNNGKYSVSPFEDTSWLYEEEGHINSSYRTHKVQYIIAYCNPYTSTFCTVHTCILHRTFYCVYC